MWPRLKKVFRRNRRISRRQAKRLAEQVGWDHYKAKAVSKAAAKYYEGERDRD